MPPPGLPATSTRRRRLLISRGQSSTDPGALVETPTDPLPSCPVLAGICRLTQQPQPLTWVFTGDSITHGALYTEGHRSFPEHLAERIRWELRRFQDVVINTGICGERSDGLLANLDSRILRFRPEVALILIGMNDCLAGVRGREPFRRNLQTLIGRLREAGVIPVLQTPNLIYTPNATSRCDLPAYVQIIREEAAHMEAALIDHWNDWCTAKPEVGAILPWLQDESIHPNQYGHREMARSICRALGLFDPNSLTCQLPAP